MSDNRELKEARELLVIRADHAGRLADEVRELEAERDGLLAKIERVRASFLHRVSGSPASLKLGARIARASQASSLTRRPDFIAQGG